MGKRLSPKQRRDRKRAKRHYSSSALSVSAIPRETGGKRKGRRMAVKPSTSRSGNIMRDQVENARKLDTEFQLGVNARGVGKILVYRKES